MSRMSWSVEEADALFFVAGEDVSGVRPDDEATVTTDGGQTVTGRVATVQPLEDMLALSIN